jgi:hypothetical protein
MGGSIAFRIPIATQILAATLMFTVPGRIAHAQANTAGHRLIVEGEFAAPESRSDRKPRGITGMACLGVNVDKKRECLTINDEDLSVEVVTLQDDSSPRSHDDAFYIESHQQAVVLIKKDDMGEDVSGQRPTANCPELGEKKFKELDGEAIALAGDYLYVAGSHACTQDGEFKPSTFLLTRFKSTGAKTISADGRPTVERTWRLGDVLPPIPSISGWMKGDPTEENIKDLAQKQRNIEGIAVVDGRLYAGLRTPNVGDDVLIVSAMSARRSTRSSQPKMRLCLRKS